MNETCDRCGPAVRAAYRVERTGALYLCGHCANRLWPALWAQGWTIWLTGAYDPRRKLRTGSLLTEKERT
jgi:ribosomal protein S27AE